MIRRRYPIQRSPFRRNKFRAKPVHDMVTGKTYDSTGEHRYLGVLRVREMAGEISDIREKEKIVLIPARGKAPEIAWKVDYSFIEDGRRVHLDYKRPPTARWGGRIRSLWTDHDRMLLKLWSHFGSGLLRIVGEGGKVFRTIMPEMAPLPCGWLEDEAGNWETDCGNLHVFLTGSPSDNRHIFCPYCGLTIKEDAL